MSLGFSVPGVSRCPCRHTQDHPRSNIPISNNILSWIGQCPSDVVDWLISFPVDDFVWIARVPLLQVLSACRSFPSGGDGDVLKWFIDVMAGYPGIGDWLRELPTSLAYWCEHTPQSLWIWARDCPLLMGG